MGFAVRVRSAGQKYGPTCHQRDHADVTEFVTLVRLSSLGQHIDVLALAGYKRRKSALTAGPICPITRCYKWFTGQSHWAHANFCRQISNFVPLLIGSSLLAWDCIPQFIGCSIVTKEWRRLASMYEALWNGLLHRESPGNGGRQTHI